MSILAHLLFWIAVDAVFDPGVIVIKAGETPAVVYDRNDESWAVPSYEQTKHIIKCIERDRTRCLRGN